MNDTIDKLRDAIDPNSIQGAFLLGFFANLATVIILWILFRGKISG